MREKWHIDAPKLTTQRLDRAGRLCGNDTSIRGAVAGDGTIMLVRNDMQIKNVDITLDVPCLFSIHLNANLKPNLTNIYPLCFR